MAASSVFTHRGRRECGERGSKEGVFVERLGVVERADETVGIETRQAGTKEVTLHQHQHQRQY